jgi:hypothetical protein
MLGDRRRPTPGSARLASLLGLENKPMFEASVELILFQRGRGSSSRQADGAPVACDLMATRGGFFLNRQQMNEQRCAFVGIHTG